jgi:hypothetical protein
MVFRKPIFARHPVSTGDFPQSKNAPAEECEFAPFSGRCGGTGQALRIVAIWYNSPAVGQKRFSGGTVFRADKCDTCVGFDHPF